MQSIPALGWPVATAIVAVGYFALPDPVAPFGTPVWSLVCAAAVLWRAAHLRRQLAWWLIGLALLTSTLGEILWTGYELSGGDPFPSYADLFYLSAFPLLGGGLVALVHQKIPGGDRASLIDASVVAVGASALAWVLVGSPYVAQGGSPVEIAVGLAYPLSDLLVLGLLCRLLLAPGLFFSYSVHLLTVGTAALLVADTAFLILDLNGDYHTGHIIDAGWLMWAGLTAAAAWQPSAIRHGAKASQTEEPPLTRLLLLAAGMLMGPVVLIIEGARGRAVDALPLGLVMAALILLVLARMAGPIRQVHTQAIALSRLGDTDQLTGLPNRRAWDRELARAVATARRTGVPLAVAVVDLDHFKRVNDTGGHAAGDRLLARAAAGWTAKLRTGDFLARYGGEEFTVLLPGANGAAAIHAAERIRIACPDGETCSVGVAVLAPGETAPDVMKRADAALYDAKRSGRNRCVLAPAPSLSRAL